MPSLDVVDLIANCGPGPLPFPARRHPRARMRWLLLANCGRKVHPSATRFGWFGPACRHQSGHSSPLKGEEDVPIAAAEQFHAREMAPASPLHLLPLEGGANATGLARPAPVEQRARRASSSPVTFQGGYDKPRAMRAAAHGQPGLTPAVEACAPVRTGSRRRASCRSSWRGRGCRLSGRWPARGPRTTAGRPDRVRSRLGRPRACRHRRRLRHGRRAW